MRAIHYFRLVALALAGTLMTPALEPPPVFRTSTTLVEFNMVVQDRNGKPITDLKNEEVSVFENDQPRQTAVFRFGGATQNSDPPQPLPAGVFSNGFGDAPGAPRNFVAIVFSGLNNPLTEKFTSQATLRERMRLYFKKLPPNTRAATYLVKYSVRLLHGFTNDFDALRASVPKTDNSPSAPQFTKDQPGGGVPPIPNMGSSSSEEARNERIAFNSRALTIANEGVYDEKVRLSLAGLEAIGNQLAGLPGRKSLVWTGFGIPLGINVNRMPKFYRAAIEKTAHRLASQGIAIYSLRGGGPGMGLLSDVTGGRVLGKEDDPASGGAAVATADQDAVYSLGFYTGEPDAQWHSLKVAVSRPGAKVLYPQGYMSAAPVAKPQEWSSDQWRSAATSPLGSTAIRFDANAHLVSGTLQATLLIAADDLHFLDGASKFDIAIAEATSGVLTDLRHVQSSIQLPENALGKGARVSSAQRWNMNPKSTDVRIIVHDRFTGAYGSVDIPVTKIPDDRTH